MPADTLSYPRQSSGRPKRPNARTVTNRFTQPMGMGESAPYRSGDQATAADTAAIRARGQSTPHYQYWAHGALNPSATPGFPEGPAGYTYDSMPWSGSMQGQVNRERMYGAAAGSGPYDGAGGNRHLMLQQQRRAAAQNPPPIRSAMTLTDPTRPLTGQFAIDAAANAAGGNRAERGSNAPVGELQEAAVARQRAQRDSYRQGRRDRAIRMHGLTHLTPSYANAPLDAERYGGAAKSGTPTADVERKARVAQHARNSMRMGADGTAEMNYDQFSKNIYPDFKDDPAGAWKVMQEHGMTADEVAEAHNSAKGTLGGMGAASPEEIAWWDGVRQAAGVEEESDIGESRLGNSIGGAAGIGMVLPGGMIPGLYKNTDIAHGLGGAAKKFARGGANLPGIGIGGGQIPGTGITPMDIPGIGILGGLPQFFGGLPGAFNGLVDWWNGDQAEESGLGRSKPSPRRKRR